MPLLDSFESDLWYHANWLDEIGFSTGGNTFELSIDYEAGKVYLTTKGVKDFNSRRRLPGYTYEKRGSEDFWAGILSLSTKMHFVILNIVVNGFQSLK